MAGSILTVTSVSHPSMNGKEQNTIVLDWLSDASAGTLSKDIASTYSTAQAVLSSYLVQPDKLKGYIVGIETIPGKDGNLTDNLPSNLYDITLDDPYDYDLAGGSLANRSGTVAEKVVPSQPIPIDSEVTLEITNAGNEKKGRIIIYISPGKK
jgi:hypothetical protein